SPGRKPWELRHPVFKEPRKGRKTCSKGLKARGLEIACTAADAIDMPSISRIISEMPAQVRISSNELGKQTVAEAGREIRRLRADALTKIPGGLRALYPPLELPGKNPSKTRTPRCTPPSSRPTASAVTSTRSPH